MRRRRMRRLMLWLAPGTMLWLSCPAGTGQFLAPVVQPIVSQVLSDIAGAITQNILDQLERP
jgi:hypothetical protein